MKFSKKRMFQGFNRNEDSNEIWNWKKYGSIYRVLDMGYWTVKCWNENPFVWVHHFYFYCTIYCTIYEYDKMFWGFKKKITRLDFLFYRVTTDWNFSFIHSCLFFLIKSLKSDLPVKIFFQPGGIFKYYR